MARRRPDDRLQVLLKTATAVFIEKGYRRTQIADIAKAMGVGKGTIYLYVDSKDALFDLVVRQADDPKPLETPRKLPITAPSKKATLRYIQEQIAAHASLPHLQSALARPSAETRAELETIIRELYAVLRDNRVGIKLVDRCAGDYPGLADLFSQVARQGVPRLLQAYIESHVAAGRFSPVPDSLIAARLIVEAIAFCAMHRYWDPMPQPFDDVTAEESVVHFAVRTLLP